MKKEQKLSSAGRTDTRGKNHPCILMPASTGSEVLARTTTSVPPAAPAVSRAS